MCLLATVIRRKISRRWNHTIYGWNQWCWRINKVRVCNAVTLWFGQGGKVNSRLNTAEKYFIEWKRKLYFQLTLCRMLKYGKNATGTLLATVRWIFQFLTEKLMPFESHLKQTWLKSSGLKPFAQQAPNLHQDIKTQYKKQANSVIIYIQLNNHKWKMKSLLYQKHSRWLMI